MSTVVSTKEDFVLTLTAAVLDVHDSAFDALAFA